MPLSNSEKKALKSRAQLMDATFKIGRQGLTDAFITSVSKGLESHPLLKVKFAELKDQKKELAPVLAERTGSELVTRVGNVVVLYKAPAKK